MSPEPRSQLQDCDPNMRISLANEYSEVIEQVVSLGDRNSKFLGHFPAALYHREAGKGRLIVAQDDAGRLLGYILFRTSTDRAVVQHLCVEESVRGQGMATKLMDDLKQRTKHLQSIICHCALEYVESMKAWERLGFVRMGEKPGRGRSQRPLIRLVYDHGHPNLFSQHESEVASSSIVACMDLNVAIALLDDTFAANPPDHEISVLNSDWLSEEVSLWITDESLNEVGRQQNSKERKKRVADLRQLKSVPRVHDVEARVFEEVVSILGQGKREQDDSDGRQLAQAIAGEADIFLTRDAEILRKADRIESRFGIQVFRPSDMVLHLDEIARQSDYIPTRLHGSAIEIRFMRQNDADCVIDKFLDYGRGEPRHQMATRLRGCVPLVDRASRIFVVEGSGGALRAVIAWEKEGRKLSIKLLRAIRDRLTETLVRHLLFFAIDQGRKEGCDVTELQDPYLPPCSREAAFALGFVEADGNVFAKWSRHGVFNRDQLWEDLRDSPMPPSAISRYLEHADQTDSQLLFEKSVWPAIVKPSTLRTFIVPIQPRYATHLFDSELSNRHLFGGDPTLLLNCENVYYRSGRVNSIPAPARILWYVSADPNGEPVRQLRAMSLVLETELGRAADLLKKYRKLGVYEWADLRRMTDEIPDKPVNAIRFGATESFPKPIGGTELRDLVGSYRRTKGVLQLLAPVEVPPDCLEPLIARCYGI